MRSEIYSAIAGRIQSAGIGIEHVSLWNQNTEVLQREAAYRLPAVFIEFSPMRWRQGLDGFKTAVASIRIHIIVETLCEPALDSPYRDEALEVLDLCDKTVRMLCGFAGDCFNGLQHVETIPDHSHWQVQHHIEVFQCELFDRRPAQEQAEVAIASINILNN